MKISKRKILCASNNKSVVNATKLAYKDIQLVMNAAANVQTLEDLDSVLSSLLSIDKHLYTKYSAAVVNSKSSPAYIGKQISDDLYYMLQDKQSVTSNSSINAAKLNYNTPELKKLRKAIQSIVVDSDAEFVQLVDDMINNVTMNYVPETRALKRCIDSMLEYDSEDEVRNWVLKYAADLGCIASNNINSASTCVNAATDVDTERYVHSLVGDVQSELSSEVDSIQFELDSNDLYVTVTFMSVTREYVFNTSELTMNWDNIDEDAAYIVNTILQDLDTMEDSVISSTAIKGGNTMKKYVQAAESDYIKIGNMVIPKNASQYGYDASYDRIGKETKARYNAEKEEERKAAEAAAKAKAGKALYNKCKQAFDSAPDDTNNKIDALFDILVPSSGKCDTQAGELIRAVARVIYRWFNDGDYFFTGYGLETCGGSAAFIADNVDSAHDLVLDAASIMIGPGGDSVYEAALDNIAEAVLDYVMNSPELFGEPASADSTQYSSYTYEEFVENSKSNEFEVDTWGFAECVNNGWATWEDFRYFLEDLCHTYGGSVSSYARDGFTITDLDYDELQEWDEMYSKEVDSYISELEEENEEYEDDEDGEDW